MSNKEFLKHMGERVREERQKRKLTLRQLDELCGINYSSIGRLENGCFNSYILTLKKIADVFNLEVKDFL